MPYSIAAAAIYKDRFACRIIAHFAGPGPAANSFIGERKAVFKRDAAACMRPGANACR